MANPTLSEPCTAGQETRAPSRRSPWVVVGALGGNLALVGLFAWGLTRDARFIPSPLLNQKAPPLELELFNGGRFSLADHQGHVVVVNFWASWCTGCEEEAAVLEAGWRTFRPYGVVFLGVNIQDKREDALEFIRRHGKSYPNGPDPEGTITIDYGVYGVPETFFIDRQGRVAHKHFGPLRWETLAGIIRDLI